MHTRIQAAAGLMAVLVAACSAPPEESRPESPRAESPDLALTAPETDAPIASELEAPRPEPEENGSVRPAARRAATPAPIGNPVSFMPEEVAASLEPGPVTAAHPRVDDTVEVPASGPYGGAAEGGKPRIPLTGGRVPDPGPGPVGIIIRGGPGREGDDCITHRPPPPNAGDVRPPEGTGVLINERTPRRGPPQVGDRMPTSGPSRVVDRTSGRGPHAGRGIR